MGPEVDAVSPGDDGQRQVSRTGASATGNREHTGEAAWD